jgi:eukaryotic-like serine/threonine-protein kinase
MESHQDKVPLAVQSVIGKSLAKEPSQRHQGTNSFFKALTQTHEPAEAVVQAKPKPPVDQVTTPAEPPGEQPAEIHTPAQSTTGSPSMVAKPPADPVAGKQRMSGWLPWLLVGMMGVTILIVLVRGNLGDGDLGSMLTYEPTDTAVVNGIIEAPVAATTDNPTPAATEIPMPSPTVAETWVPTRTPTPEPTPISGSNKINENDGALMVYVPEGEFLMGSEDADADSDEKPRHPVYLDAFWIYQTEVTNGMYRQCVEKGACQLPGNTTFYQNQNYADHPVVYVSWFDAVAYCQWAGGQLPTEAQWEKAARGTGGSKYPWGDSPITGRKANFCDSNCELSWADTRQDDGFSRTSPVGSFPDGASPYDALDMAGNVWEWVADWYNSTYYSRSPYTNPIGQASGTDRVLRGGSWNSDERHLRVSFRNWNLPASWDGNRGFRCAFSVAP